MKNCPISQNPEKYSANRIVQVVCNSGTSTCAVLVQTLAMLNSVYVYFDGKEIFLHMIMNPCTCSDYICFELK